jgi:hypothetical protein
MPGGSETPFKYLGFYRAKVVEVNIENNNYGGIRVFIPDLMTTLDPDYDENKMGIIAYPANSPLGGRNPENKDSYYTASVYIPPKGSFVWVFFEMGDVNRPYYFASLDIRTSKLPPENRNVQEPHKVYTIIKSGKGRSIIVADSEDVQRVEITGKKRMLQGADPAGNADSVYETDGNQTTILLDEKEGAEKLLIKTHYGDYLNIDISNRRLNAYFSNGIRIKTDQKLSIQAGTNIEIKAGQEIHMDAINVWTNSGMAIPDEPEGSR